MKYVSEYKSAMYHFQEHLERILRLYASVCTFTNKMLKHNSNNNTATPGTNFAAI